MENSEIWKDIEGFPGYDVSNYGRVRSWYRRGSRWPFATPRVLAQSNADGYSSLTLCRDRKRHTCHVHQLVANAFVPGRTNARWRVNHKDGIKLNNRASNLEWTTRSEDAKHACAIGLQSNRGERHSQAKLTEKQIREIREHLLAGLLLHREIAKIFNVAKATISDIKNHRSWKHVQ